ncbi:MAG: pyrroline-5-carboxylate reductase [Desulfobacterales bacterium]|nr:pyrroline-5-carboxylate reductase [Desulfobacterales bacterium]
MSIEDKKIGFIGAGNMGEAILAALIKTKLSQSNNLYITDISKERIGFIKDTYSISALDDNSKLFLECDIIILAVKPQQMKVVLSEIQKTINKIKNRKIVISIAAGFTIKNIENILYSRIDEITRSMLPVVRVMPNTPALVLAGISGMSANRFACKEDVYLSKLILGSMGKVIEFEEEKLDAVTALSGSGPAYVFYLMESMIEAGIKLGFEPLDAALLTTETLKGAVKLMEEKGEPPWSLRAKVTSKGGTTEAAFKILEAYDVKQIIIDAVNAAHNRSKELSK